MMRIAFYSEKLKQRIAWAQCPIWIDIHGNEREICMNFDPRGKFFAEKPSRLIRFYFYNKKKYPDLVAFPVLKVVQSGIKGTFLGSYI